MTSASTFLRTAGTAAFCLLAATPSFAGSVGAPAPLIGAGLPALAVFGAGYWAVRKLRRR
jgi:lipopolysaccharide export LptBFGC system permease protein LptF